MIIPFWVLWIWNINTRKYLSNVSSYCRIVENIVINKHNSIMHIETVWYKPATFHSHDQNRLIHEIPDQISTIRVEPLEWTGEKIRSDPDLHFGFSRKLKILVWNSSSRDGRTNEWLRDIKRFTSEFFDFFELCDSDKHLRLALLWWAIKLVFIGGR